MRFSKFGVIALFFILFISIFIAKVSNIITVNTDAWEKFFSKNKRIENYNDKIRMGSTMEHLIWFIQVSDLHISIFHDSSRISELQEFCDITVGVIKPTVVLASGDLTDAKQDNNIGSSQFEGEWIHYKRVLDKCKVTEKTVWLDVRGNHDNFNVRGPKAKENYFQNYSIQGPTNPHSYIHQVTTKDNDTYSFIALDACLEPGPRRPFNFMGVITGPEMEKVKAISQQAVGSNMTVWFGHYPTSCILSPSKGGGVRSVIGERGVAYLCGHLHTLGGAVPNMYTLQHAGFLELELADWKDNRMFRLAAIDHDTFSFVDIKHRDWPAILVTNPKHALFAAPGKEPLDRIERSSHIRILVFSLSTVIKVKVRIDKGEWEECNHLEAPLFTHPWQPEKYRHGLHHIEVYATDLDGRNKVVSQPFSLDGTRLSFGFMPRFILMCDINTLFHLLFGLTVAGCVLPLCVLRCAKKAILGNYLACPRFRVRFLQRLLRRWWIISNVDTFYYSFILYPLYIAVGPWAIGEIIENYFGVIFIWGTFVNQSYLPGSFTYVYGFVQLLLFQFPMMTDISFILDRRLHYKQTDSRKGIIGTIGQLCRMCPFIAIVLLQIIFTYCFWLEYGNASLLFGPLRSWSVIFCLWLYYKAKTVPEAELRDAAKTLYSSSPFTVTITACEGDGSNSTS